jgi:hypothetical protein
MAIILMEFLRGYTGELYQETSNGQVVRWLDTDGNEVPFPSNGDAGVSYTSKDPQPPVPSWYDQQ